MTTTRRDLIALLGSTAAVAWPRTSWAQQSTSPRQIGVLLVGLSPDSSEAKQFRLGLRDKGYSEGRDVVIEWRSAKGDYDRVPELVADLVRRKVDVIVQDSTVGTDITKRATSTIPIVMALVLDPIGSGLVKSLARPGGNVTGLSMMATELYPKRLQLLKEVNPNLANVAVLYNPDHPFHVKAVEELKAIAPSLSIRLSVAAARIPEQFASAFSEIALTKADDKRAELLLQLKHFARREFQ